MRELIVQLGQCLAVFSQHFGVELAGGAARAGRPEILVNALAAPGCFDEQHRFVVRVAGEVAQLKLRPDVVFATVAGEADRQATGLEFLLGLVTDKHVVPNDPVAVGIDDVPVSVGVLRGLHHVFQDTPAAVVVLGMIKIDDALTLHVRLAGKPKDTQRVRRLEVFIEECVAGVLRLFVEHHRKMASAPGDVQTGVHAGCLERLVQCGRSEEAHCRMFFRVHERIDRAVVKENRRVVFIDERVGGIGGVGLRFFRALAAKPVGE